MQCTNVFLKLKECCMFLTNRNCKVYNTLVFKKLENKEFVIIFRYNINKKESCTMYRTLKSG